MVSSGEAGEVIQVIDFATGRDLLAARATDADTRNGETVPALVIQGTFSGCCRTVIGS
jgi:hypothetical protein